MEFEYAFNMPGTGLLHQPRDIKPRYVFYVDGKPTAQFSIVARTFDAINQLRGNFERSEIDSEGTVHLFLTRGY